MQNLQLTKSSSESDLKRYFTAVLELSKSDNKFPINLDEVWPLVYSEKSKAVRVHRKNFFENEDYTRLAQNGESVKRQENGRLDGSFQTSYFLSLSCMEYFIARKVRPVFEVYRQVFHHTTKKIYQPALPQNYKQALLQLVTQIEQNEKLQIENKRLQDDMASQQILNSHLIGENEQMKPKVRVYEQIMQSPEDSNLRTTTAMANEIGMSGQKLNRLLVAAGIIYKTPNKEYLFCADYLRWKLGEHVSVVVNENKGIIKTYIKWNARGRAYIHALNDTKWDKRRAWHLIKEGKENVCVV